MDRASAGALAVEALYQGLSGWIGMEGCHALFARARAQAQGNHPPLETLQLRARAKPYMDGLAEGVAKYGEPATAAAITSMLASMIELLGRLIGSDMANNLIERSLPDRVRDAAAPEPRSAEA
jgi:transcriptional regulator GlxA family with amidase domain